MTFMRALFLCAVLLFAGCGFSPLYGTHGDNAAVTQSFDSVFIANIPDREGQYLRNALIDRLYAHGRPADPRYTLTIDRIQRQKRDLDITKNASATRAQLRLDAGMTLTENANGKILLKRGLISITSYNILQSQFTTRISEDDAQRSALDDLARQAEQHLALYFGRNAP